MTGETRVRGIVLTSMPIGEYDRRITILTAERGRISAFAKGARRQTSAFCACTQTFTYGEFMLYEGRDSYNLMGVEKAHYFSELREDLEGLYYGMYFCELAGSLTREGADEAEQMKLLYVSLKALTVPAVPNRLVRCIYEQRAICIYGEGMQTEGRFYSGKFNGLVNERYADAIEVSESTLYAVQYMLSAPIKSLYSFTVTDEVLEELEHITRDYLERHVDRQMKSLEVLEGLI